VQASVVRSDDDVIFDDSYTLGIARHFSGPVDLVLCVGGATQPHDALVIGVDFDMRQTLQMLGSEFSLDFGGDA